MNKIIDMHCDTISVLLKYNSNLDYPDNMINIDKLYQGGYFLQCFAMFVVYKDKDNPNYSPYLKCKEMINKYEIEMESFKDRISKVLSIADLDKNYKENKLSSLLTIEEGGALEGSLDKLQEFYDLGVRMICLTWNFQNEIASPNIDYLKMDKGVRFNSFYDLVPNKEDGLTEFGINVVKKMNELGMVIDCSHLGDKGFYDVIKYSTKPIVCSHSCARGVCNCVRNMSDDMLFKLKENGGVVGINYCHDFVKEERTVATVKDIVKHIDYIKNLIGIDYIGLGSDFDGISNEQLELKDASMMDMLIDELRNSSYTQEEIDKITHLNVMRVLKANLK